jgi:hypothetical protein
MLFRSRHKESRPKSPIADQASRAYELVRAHWATCDSCRDAAAKSAALWCEQGLELMRRGVAEDPHWERCAQCRQAQELVRSSQCAEGRDLEERFHVLVRSLAGA